MNINKNIFESEYFLKWNNSQRGMYLQLLILSKCGKFKSSSCASAAHLLCTDRSTLGRFVLKNPHQMHTSSLNPWIIDMTQVAQRQKVKPQKALKNSLKTGGPILTSIYKEDKKSIKLSNSDRFNKYRKENMTSIKNCLMYLLEVSYLGDYDERWLATELGHMASWIEGAGEQGNKQRWGKFISNWLKNANYEGRPNDIVPQ